jgi:hypothetical protein
LSGAELIAFVIRSAYDKFPHAFRREEFFFDTDDGVGGIPRKREKISINFRVWRLLSDEEYFSRVSFCRRMAVNNLDAFFRLRVLRYISIVV